jgi:hypothetical protein
MAVDRINAPPGLRFTQYIDYLINSGEIPKSHLEHLNLVRALGNNAAHTLEPVEKTNADAALQLTELALRNLYSMSNHPFRSAQEPSGGHDDKE